LKCPYCDHEMEDGYLWGGANLTWDDHRPRIICVGKVRLDFGVWRCAHVLASRCSSCGAIVVPPNRMRE